MQEILEDKLCEEQAGFRPKQSCTEQIFTLHYIIEKCQEFQVPLVISFLDFSEALKTSADVLYGKFSPNMECQTSWYVQLRGSTTTQEKSCCA